MKYRSGGIGGESVSYKTTDDMVIEHLTLKKYDL